jgi:hypothetical protein
MKMTKTLYGNCSVFSPSDILMFKCNDKKANWYLKRGLAEKIQSDPTIIKLNFEPNGLGNHNKSYGLGEMMNKCVNCGTEEDLTKHHVVPICYRRFFPMDLKSHNFHDVLAMCVDCHEKYERKADIVKVSLSKQYDAPVNGIIRKTNLSHIKIANALLYRDLPNNRNKELKLQLKTILNIKRLTRKRLIETANLDIKSSTVITTHGEIVVNKLNNINEFIQMWRKHFLDNNECKFIPKDWNIKNNL